MNNILTYLLTYLRNNNNNNNNNNNLKKPESHTSLIIYKREDWIKFKHIIEFQGTNPNRIFWAVVDLVLEQYDMKEHSLDKFLEELELTVPTIETDPEKVLRYLQSLPMEKVKELEEKVMRDYIYIKAITQGEIELENFPYLWRKYK